MVGLGKFGAGRQPSAARPAGRCVKDSSRSFVTVVQPADHRNADHTTMTGRFNGPRERRVSVRREVRASLMVVGEILRQNTTRMILVEHDQVVEALSAYAPDEPFDERILPGTPLGGEHLVDATEWDMHGDLSDASAPIHHLPGNALLNQTPNTRRQNCTLLCTLPLAQHASHA